MIQKFNQFINENHQTDVHNAISEPALNFIERVQERTKMFAERINEIASNLSKAVEDVMEEFGDIIVGEPIVETDRNLWDMTVTFNTNIPNVDELDEDGETPVDKLDSQLYDVVKRYGDIRASVSYKPNDDGNCVFTLEVDIVYDSNFGDFTEALSTLGQDW